MDAYVEVTIVPSIATRNIPRHKGAIYEWAIEGTISLPRRDKEYKDVDIQLLQWANNEVGGRRASACACAISVDPK